MRDSLSTPEEISQEHELGVSIEILIHSGGLGEEDGGMERRSRGPQGNPAAWGHRK